MFCFQCQETAKGTGCTIKGVCGKEATTSKWQDLLLSVVRGIGTIQHSIGKEPTPEVTRFLTDALFTTFTMPKICFPFGGTPTPNSFSSFS